ncbi:MAG: histidine--tRNA ligase [Pseudomonadales bacterium]|nr:histidine--tRNA ligase [Pseudomonadales bacterium]
MNIQSIRGMRDLLPNELQRWHHIERTLIDVTQSFGFRELRFPLLEFTTLFARGVGESTDIIEKEMYSLADRDGESLSLRPEGTASCIRAALQHGLLHNQIQNFWYRGPMFRYERPQKGRYRQFEQFGVESFGVPSFAAEAELIQLSAAVFDALGMRDALRLEINTLGTLENRRVYRQALVDFLTPHRDELDEDSKRRLDSNPLRILDSKNEKTRVLLENAPGFTDYLEESAVEHFESFKQVLQSLGIQFEVNPKLVRGLDYYTHTVFEWMTDQLGAQGTVCAGGRYDGLVEQLGGKATPGAGYAMGIDRLVLLHETLGGEFPLESIDVYCITMDEAYLSYAFDWCARLRQALPGRTIVLHKSAGKFQKQLKRADKSGAKMALLIGEQEVASNTATIKWLREEKTQQTLDFAALCKSLS